VSKLDDKAAGRDAPGEPSGEMSDRERTVLQAIVDEHIQSAEPVGSKALAERPELGVSPATIRAVMQSLGERGLIAQPHTSAGRVPTDKGFRFYVDEIMRVRAPAAHEQAEIGDRIERAGAVDRAMAEASRALAKIARHASIVVAPRTNSVRVKLMEFVRLRDDAVLVILVTAEGMVQNRLVEWGGFKVAPIAADLERMGRYLSDLLEGKTLDEGRALLEREVRSLESERATLQSQAVAIGQAALDEGQARVDRQDVHVEGTAHLLGAAQVDRIKDVLSLLEERQRVGEILDATVGAPGIRVFIGEENRMKELAELSVVTATYGTGDEVLGTLGVIGPVRLDYARVVPLVDYTASTISRLLNKKQ
jgi:heat-inducible transcriptional repressor